MRNIRETLDAFTITVYSSDPNGSNFRNFYLLPGISIYYKQFPDYSNFLQFLAQFLLLGVDVVL